MFQIFEEREKRYFEERDVVMWNSGKGATARAPVAANKYNLEKLINALFRYDIDKI